MHVVVIVSNRLSEMPQESRTRAARFCPSERFNLSSLRLDARLIEVVDLVEVVALHQQAAVAAQHQAAGAVPLV
jgi:hypothetical protein